MIGQIVTDKDGAPIDGAGNKLAKSLYTPPLEVKELFGLTQKDFQAAWTLQHKGLDEFDGYSVLQRAKLDQQTFAAFVGLEFVPTTKKWRWKGRKNTARNKLIGILAHMIAGMLYPFVFAQNDQDEEDKMTARVMRILIEERLRTANYEKNFFFSVLTALVNPAVFVSVEYVEELTRIRERMRNGEMKVRDVVDEAVSGLLLNIVPLDELLLGDFYSGTGDIQALPYMIRMRRISYDKAKGRHGGKHFYAGRDLFDFVEAGKTKWMAADADQTLFDVEDNEVDANFVMELTIKWRKEDLELTWVGGVGMFDHAKPYDNPFKHRRMALDTKTKEWYTIPMYNIAMTGFEPIDPEGRFVWFKSGAFKEYWEDKKITELDRMFVDGVKLDTFKPLFLAGVAKVDGDIMAPGAAVTMPLGATATPYNLGSNLVATHNAIVTAAQDMSESTQDKVMQGVTEKGITATQTNEARQNARIFMGVFAFMIASLTKQIGELSADIVIANDTIGDIEAYSAGSVRMKFPILLARGKEKGKDITHKIVFTDKYMGRNVSKDREKEIEYDLFEKSGGKDSDQRIWEVNPYRFARTRYSMFIDADQIVTKSMGTDRLEKDQAFEKFMDPRVMPYIDAEAVVEDFIIEEYGQGDPERYKRKDGGDGMMEALMSQMTPKNGNVTPNQQIQ